jgi:LPS-assembly lipoprotein
LFKQSKILSVIALVACLGACGFQLQGALTMPPEMTRTYIESDDRRSHFYRALKSEMQAAGIVIVDSAVEATATFVIAYDDTSQRVLSVSARNVPTEYEVYYTVVYRLRAPGKGLMQEQELTLTRDYTYDSTLVLGKAREEELLREAIVKDLVRVVLRQIARL